MSYEATSLKQSIRMFCRQRFSTLNGYVCSNREHARQWLTQSFVKPKEIRLEEVTVSERVACKHCRGAGWHQAITPGRKLTVDEFLKEPVDV